MADSSPWCFPNKDSNSSRIGFSAVETNQMSWMIFQECDSGFSKAIWPERGLMKAITNQVMRFAQLGVRGSGTHDVRMGQSRQKYWTGMGSVCCVYSRLAEVPGRPIQGRAEFLWTTTIDIL